MHQPMVVERVSGTVGEHELVERARHGDRSAYGAIVAARLPSALRLARAIVGSPADADDVVQDAFVQAWRTLPHLRDTSRFDAWFQRVLVNTARMHLRRSSRTITGRVGTVDMSADDPTLGRLDPAVEGLASSDALRRAIDRLDPDDRALLALHHLEDRPVREIAAAFGIPVGTAKWRLHQARAALKRAMETQR